jgi:hypothetical protein
MPILHIASCSASITGKFLVRFPTTASAENQTATPTGAISSPLSDSAQTASDRNLVFHTLIRFRVMSRVQRRRDRQPHQDDDKVVRHGEVMQADMAI